MGREEGEQLKEIWFGLICSPGKVGFYPPLIAKETKPTALRALVCI